MRKLAVLFLASMIPAMLTAQTGCPANVKAIPFHSVNRQMIVAVSINGSGPYDFLVDTGSQVTVLDRSIAAELHIPATRKADVTGVSFQGAAMYGLLNKLEVGDHAATSQYVLVYDMKNVHAAGFAIHGLLGDDFLSQFDVLINNAHKVLCMDDTGAMQESMNGERLPQITPSGALTF